MIGNLPIKKILIVLIVIAVIAAAAYAFFTWRSHQNKVAVEKKSIATEEEIKQLQGKTAPLPKEAEPTKQKVIDKTIRTNYGDKILEENKNFRITYVPTPDIFVVSIFKQPAQDYKNFAESWFLAQGFNRNDLCGLGIKFVYDIEGLTTTEKAKYSTLVSNCQPSK